MHGARITLTIMVLVTIVVRPIWHLFGTVAGDFGGRVDTVLMRCTDIFLSFPSLILSLAFVAALRPGLNNAIIAIALTAWPPIALLARGERRLSTHRSASIKGADEDRICALPDRRAFLCNQGCLVNSSNRNSNGSMTGPLTSLW